MSLLLLSACSHEEDTTPAASVASAAAPIIASEAASEADPMDVAAAFKAPEAETETASEAEHDETAATDLRHPQTDAWVAPQPTVYDANGLAEQCQAYLRRAEACFTKAPADEQPKLMASLQQATSELVGADAFTCEQVNQQFSVMVESMGCETSTSASAP